MDFQERLNRVNGRLKAAKFPCRINQINQWLYVRGTFPPPPESVKDRPCKHRIALGLPTDPRRLALAEDRAKEIGFDLEAGRFDWDQ